MKENSMSDHRECRVVYRVLPRSLWARFWDYKRSHPTESFGQLVDGVAPKLGDAAEEVRQFNAVMDWELCQRLQALWVAALKTVSPPPSPSSGDVMVVSAHGHIQTIHFGTLEPGPGYRAGVYHRSDRPTRFDALVDIADRMADLAQTSPSQNTAKISELEHQIANAQKQFPPSDR
jgi:hypothetical protein